MGPDVLDRQSLVYTKPDIRPDIKKGWISVATLLVIVPCRGHLDFQVWTA